MFRVSRIAILPVTLCLNLALFAAAPDEKPKTESQSSDARIVQAVKEISAQKIEQTIQHLVGFHTRLTVSTNLPVESGRECAQQPLGSNSNLTPTPRNAADVYR